MSYISKKLVLEDFNKNKLPILVTITINYFIII